MEDGPANSSSDTPAEVQTSLRSLRPLRRRKRSHSQLEEQGTASDADGDHDSDYVEAGGQSPSPDRTESLHSQDGGNIAAHANDAPTIPVHGSSVRTAWSVLVAKYPEEIALAFREGQRPTNSQLKAMLDLPAVNSLVDNPMRRARSKPWSIQNARRTGHLFAALTQITGTAAFEPCDRCEKGGGLWKGCYTRVPLGAARLDERRVCANCMMQGKSGKCRWKQGPALPPTGIQLT